MDASYCPVYKSVNLINFTFIGPTPVQQTIQFYKGINFFNKITYLLKSFFVVHFYVQGVVVFNFYTSHILKIIYKLLSAACQLILSCIFTLLIKCIYYFQVLYISVFKHQGEHYSFLLVFYFKSFLKIFLLICLAYLIVVIYSHVSTLVYFDAIFIQCLYVLPSVKSQINFLYISFKKTLQL